jgi:NAD(P)-dependent dehydrogenase (short-subunit alcohol dehydrogenase family)
LLTGSRGAIVNVLSNSALAALPLIPAYSISKAAAFSLSQSLRALLAGAIGPRDYRDRFRNTSLRPWPSEEALNGASNDQRAST